MPLLKSLQNLCTGVFNYAQDPGRALLHLGAVGWVLSGAAQLFMVATNQKIDPEQKKFLIPQEAADAAVNVGLYYTITAGIKNIADAIVEKGFKSPQKTFDTLNAFNSSNAPFSKFVTKSVQSLRESGHISEKQAKKGISSFYTGLQNLLADDNNALKNLKEAGLVQDIVQFSTLSQRKDLLEQVKTAETGFKNFKGGVGTVAAVVASVLASSVITPVVRNKVANACQKRALENDKNQPAARNLASYTDAWPPIFTGFKI